MTKLVCVNGGWGKCLSLNLRTGVGKVGPGSGGPAVGEVVSMVERVEINYMAIISLAEYGADLWYPEICFKPLDDWRREQDREAFRKIGDGTSVPDCEPGGRVPARPKPERIGAKLAKISNDFDAEIEVMRHNSPL